jgi:hypothetical protein
MLARRCGLWIWQPSKNARGTHEAMLRWRSTRGRCTNGLHGSAPYLPSSGGDAHRKEAGVSVCGLMGHANENPESSLATWPNTTPLHSVNLCSKSAFF